MKKLNVIIMVFALVMGFTQCKKNNPAEEVNEPVLEGETYNVTLTLGSSNSRSGVDPNDSQDIAPVTFEVGDVIYVAYNGAHCGSLECRSLSSTDTDQNGDELGVFEGTITTTQDGDKPLYFYFLGNKPATVASGNGSYTVDLSDQSAALPVISYAASKESFPSSDGKYTVEYNWLMNQCALVKFKMENIYNMSANTNDNNADAIYKTTKPITIYGMDNQVTVNLSSNEFTWSQTNDGAVSLYRNDATNDSVRYAIVHNKNYGIAQGALDVEFNPSSDPYGFYGTYKIQGNVALNDYFQDAKIDLVWHSGAFTISASGNKAYFSRGNLQYKHYGSSTADGGTWRFAKHQYDYVGGMVGSDVLHYNDLRQGNVVLQDGVAGDTGFSTNEQIGEASYVGWIDLFGYGTGDNPTKHSVLNSQYNDWHEWGTHSIVNSGKPGNTAWWQTLTHNEWKYLLSERTDYNTKRGTAIVNGVKGFVILPDCSTTTIVSYSNHAEWNNNNYTTAQWKAAEAAGAIFLPCAGYRNGTDFDGGTNADQDHGAYWSSSMSTSAASWGIRFKTTNNYAYLEDDYPMAPDNGHAVRLVHKESGSKFFNKE
ncbi:MAG: hypothetical protein IKT08_04545 [Bacteroidales bacterium]|nr:hypothetical protein [Bacteroidales bacterium]